MKDKINSIKRAIRVGTQEAKNTYEASLAFEKSTRDESPRIVDGQVAQGDVLITPVDCVPDDYKTAAPEKNGDHIITHSETGHHHVMPAKTVDFYQAANDAFTAYIVVKETSDLKHLRSFDTHKTLTFPPGTYRINRQGEETPSGWERVAD